MKNKLFSGLLFLLIGSMLLVSCKTTEVSVDESSEITEEASGYVPSDTELLLVADNQTYCGIVRSKDISKDLLSLCFDFSNTVKESTGVDVEMISDSKQLPNGMVEILIGDTNRSESVQAKEKLGKFEYSISVINRKVVVVGYDDVMLESAISQLINIVNHDPEQLSKGIFTFPIDYSQTFDGSDYKYNAYVGKGYSLTSKFTAVKKMSTSYGMTSDGYKMPWVQGGCTDGTYYYYLMRTDDSSPTKICVILKFDLATQTMVGRSGEMKLDHANDAAYNPHNDTITVIGGGSVHYVLDAKTLEVVKTVPAAFSSGVVTYDPDKHMYIIGDNYKFYCYDDEFNFIKEISIDGVMLSEFDKNGNMGSQGMTSDDKFIYYLEYWQNKTDGYDIRCNIVVFDLNDGSYIQRIPLDMGVEVENIIIWDNSFYIVCNNITWTGAECYRVEIVPEI